ncbi:MAG: hypothetical protein GY756_00935 [bacterium]|nr:hypothetical protein [bacterium]
MISKNNSEIKSYIQNNAANFDFTALFKLLKKMNYSLNNIRFTASESLKSPVSYIDAINFYDEFVDVKCNEIFIASFLYDIKNMKNCDHRISNFFSKLISKILFEYITSVYPEGKEIINEYYDEGNSIISAADVNLKSFAFIYSYLENLFSEYNLVIYLKDEIVESNNQGCQLGYSQLDKYTSLGDNIENFKEFIVLRFITENFIDYEEIDLINQRLKIFGGYFYDILDSICIITENQITDETLYSILPIEINNHSVLIHNLVRLNKTVIK